ncbi:MAG: hypothetical protein AAF513_08170 [Pseudomonadota bacterium]
MSESSAAPGQYPGLKRLPYVLSGLGLTALLVLIAILDTNAYPFPLFVLIAYVCGCFYVAYLRFRNQGTSGWWILGFLVPILNIYVGIRALAYPEGYAEHKRLDTKAKIIIGVSLAILLWLIVTIVF